MKTARVRVHCVLVEVVAALRRVRCVQQTVIGVRAVSVGRQHIRIDLLLLAGNAGQNRLVRRFLTVTDMRTARFRLEVDVVYIDKTVRINTILNILIFIKSYSS